MVKKNTPDAGLWLLIAIAVLLIGGAIFIIYTVQSDPLEELLNADRVINTLFVIEDAGKPIGSYVLMYYPETRRAAVFDIPGEVGLIISQINRVDRIDTVYDSRRVSDFQKEIEKLLDIEIQYILIFDTDSLGKVVDLIEGVTIFIPTAVERYEGERPVLFPSGYTRLDGDKARQWLTYPSGENDTETEEARRQRFFLGFIKRLGEQNEALRNTAVSGLYQGLIKTSMNERTRIRLFDAFAHIDTERLTIQTVTGTVREVSGQRLIFPSYDGNLIKQIVRETSGSLTRQTEIVGDRNFTVEVLNGTSVVGLATRTADLLRGFGYDVINVGNADIDDLELTQIVDRSGDSIMAEAFAGVIRCAQIRIETPELETEDYDQSLLNLTIMADFTLILGRDFDGRYASGK